LTGGRVDEVDGGLEFETDGVDDFGLAVAVNFCVFLLCIAGLEWGGEGEC
jgi:hypothetical protein